MPVEDFGPHTSTATNHPSPFVISASTSFVPGDAFKPFNGTQCDSNANVWIGTGAGTDWIKLDIGSGNARRLVAYGIAAGPNQSRAPKDWVIEGSNDDSSWDPLGTVTNQTSWGNHVTRMFEVDTQTDTYRYFRISISTHNGGGDYTEIGWLAFYGDDGGGGGGSMDGGPRFTRSVNGGAQ